MSVLQPIDEPKHCWMRSQLRFVCLNTQGKYAGMGNFRINTDFRIENFDFKHDNSLLHLFTRPSFCIISSYLGLYMPETNY